MDLRLHRRRVHHAGDGLQHIRHRAGPRATARIRKVNPLAHFQKPAAGSWTEHYPDLGTAPVDYTRLHRPGVLRGRAQRHLPQDLAVHGLVEKRQGGQLLHARVARGQHLAHLRQGQGQGDPVLPQCAGIAATSWSGGRLPQRGDGRFVPPVRLQAPRVALPARR